MKRLRLTPFKTKCSGRPLTRPSRRCRCARRSAQAPPAEPEAAAQSAAEEVAEDVAATVAAPERDEAAVPKRPVTLDGRRQGTEETNVTGCTAVSATEAADEEQAGEPGDEAVNVLAEEPGDAVVDAGEAVENMGVESNREPYAEEAGGATGAALCV